MYGIYRSYVFIDANDQKCAERDCVEVKGYPIESRDGRKEADPWVGCIWRLDNSHQLGLLKWNEGSCAFGGDLFWVRPEQATITKIGTYEEFVKNRTEEQKTD